MRKKILFLTNLLPYPPDNGGKIKTLSVLTALSKSGLDITLVCFSEDKQGMVSDFLEQNTIRIQKLICLKRDLTTSSNLIKMSFIAARSLFSKLPFSVMKYKSLKLSRVLKKLCKQESYDLVYFDHLQMMVFEKNVATVEKKLLDEHNCESELAKQRLAQTNNWLKRRFLKIEYKKLCKFESKALRDVDHVILLSDQDKDILASIVDGEFSYDIIPIGVKDRSLKSYRTNIAPLRILFLGTLTWEPNVRGIEWFINEVMPFAENTELIVAGRGFDKHFERDNIHVLGYVEDIDEVYDECDVMVVPLFMGSGQRVKIIEAYSKGMPIITTTVGVEGLVYTDRENVLIANNAEEFLSAIQMITNHDNYLKFARNARYTYENYYSKAIIEKKIIASMDSLIK